MRNSIIKTIFSLLWLIPATVFCQGFHEDFELLNKYSIQTDSLDYEFCFQVEGEDQLEPENVIYYWFKKGRILQTYGNYSGKLLHDTFKVYHKNGLLAEKGKLSYGTKEGKWYQWDSNGLLTQISEWKSGRLHGTCITINNKTNRKIAKYKNGQKHGKQITIKDEETTTIRYKKGRLIKEKSAKQFIKKVKLARQKKKEKKETEIPKLDTTVSE